MLIDVLSPDGLFVDYLHVWENPIDLKQSRPCSMEAWRDVCRGIQIALKPMTVSDDAGNAAMRASHRFSPEAIAVK